MDLKLGIVKGTHKLLSLFGRGGSLPGSIALKLDKDFIKRFKMPEIVILVTGTNGKTTTSNLIAESLRASGLKVINNHRGDNLNVGIATLLATNADANYVIHADAVVIEVDELTLYRQFDHLHPSHLVVTNFFRDQLDRAGEMETIIRKIMAVTKNFTGTLILNGDDPNVLRLKDNAEKAKTLLFSVGKNEESLLETNEASEGKFCPRCGNRLHYDYYQYSHIGRFNCPKDHYGEIAPDIFVEKVDKEKGTFIVNNTEFHSFINALYAIYNCASVLCVMKSLNLDLSNADKVFRTYSLKEGRNEEFNLNKPCIINLIKNPTGANEVMKEINSHEEDKMICIFLNDNDQDGHDISWIWDAHFERLNQKNIREIVCSGLRAYDMALRLKYEGLEDKIKVIEDSVKAVHYLNEANMNSYIMCTYTALHATRAILRKEEK
ncbi:MAG: MurT ligase domain-containing protein [Erysipelotrichaceae bacterium]|nr:MurT ligase domain-containing protein [Erysipelotrichaceae bacterium]